MAIVPFKVKDNVDVPQSLSATTVFAGGGTSNQWNSTYSTVGSNSASWQSSYTTINAQSASNASVYTTVNANSATWGTGSGTPTYEPAQYTRWSFTGNAPTSTFSIPGATSTESAAYRVTIDFLLQDPISYTINAAADTITFAEAPLAGSEIIVIEELFAALSAGSSNNWNSVYSTVCANSAFWSTSFITVNSDTYTLQLSDKGKTITDVYNTFTTIEVPADASVLFATGDQINLIQDNKSASNYTVVSAGPSVTINSFNNSLSLGGNYAAATLIKKDTNTWYLIGNLK